MHTVHPSPAAIEAFQKFYLAELDERVKRSEVVGAIALKKSSAALFYEPESGKFTLVEKPEDMEEAHIFDCVQREQWGRMVMLLGHATNTGVKIPGLASVNQHIQYEWRIETPPVRLHCERDDGTRWFEREQPRFDFAGLRSFAFLHFLVATVADTNPRSR